MMTCPRFARQIILKVIQKLEDQGSDAVVLGCTEIPLIVDPDDCPLPALDSMRLLARHALNEAIKRGQQADQDRPFDTAIIPRSALKSSSFWAFGRKLRHNIHKV